MKWILIALLLLAVALIVYAVVGRRDAAADREADTDRAPSGAVPTGDAEAPAADEYPTEPGRPVDTRSTVFDDPEPVAQPAEARPADADTAPTASTEPEEGDMFGWGKDKDKDEQDEAGEGSRLDERTETQSEDYVPRRGAGVDDDDRAEGAVRGVESDGPDQPMWTTSAHDPDHTVAEERTDGGRTRFDEDVTTTASDDQVEESQEGAFQPTGGDDVVDDPRPGDGESGAATDVRDDQPVEDERGSATDLHAEQPVEQDDESEANAASAADPDAAARAGDGAPQGAATGADDAAGALDDDDAGVAPGEAQPDESEAAAHGSREAYEAGQASAGAASGDGSGERSDDVSRDDDALEGATDGSAGAGALDRSGGDDRSGSHDDNGSREHAEDDGHEEPADPAEFRQPGDWVADEEGGPQVQTAEDAAELRGGPTTVDDGAVAGSDGDSGSEQQDGGDAQQHDATDSDGAEDGGGWTRRVSGLEEIRDGGYGVGSAATFEDHAMPLGHPVKAWEDTKTYVDESHPAYGDAEPHVWFADQEAAERAGFRRVD